MIPNTFLNAVQNVFSPAPTTRETYMYFDDPQGNQVGYKNTRTGSKVAGLVSLLDSMGAKFKDSEGNSPPPGFMRDIDRQGDPSRRYHFQNVNDAEQPGFYVEGSNLGNIGPGDFMHGVVQNNPQWQFGQTWGRDWYGVDKIPLPRALQYQPTFTQNRRLIDGRPHVWDGRQWVPAEGY